jgi:hypothetical protein
MESFQRLQAGLSGPAGIAVFRTRGDTGQILTAGTEQSGVAWSTYKVPLAIAALGRTPDAHTRALVRTAITESNNAAAEKLWHSLGSGPAAARATEAVLRASGDQATVVESRQVRPPYSAAGQSHWTLGDAARFASALPCLPQAGNVLTLMGQITPSQRWGLGVIPGVAFKGGWGPTSRGGYLVRQLGVRTAADGSHLGISIMVRSPAGFGPGTTDLTRIAEWLRGQLATLPTGHC